MCHSVHQLDQDSLRSELICSNSIRKNESITILNLATLFDTSSNMGFM